MPAAQRWPDRLKISHDVTLPTIPHFLAGILRSHAINYHEIYIPGNLSLLAASHCQIT